MATERTGQTEVETSAQPVNSSEASNESTEQGSVQTGQSRAWYQFIGEDWLATIIGIILVVLVVVRIFHAIP